MILLDTNVISEFVRPHPDPVVQAFVLQQPRDALFTAAICVAEISYGLARMPPGRRRNELGERMAAFLSAGFEARILPFDAACAAAYGDLRAGRKHRGSPIEVEDAMIAATALAHGAALATRNVRDFDECGVAVVNPWERRA